MPSSSFHSTSWTLVLAAGDTHTGLARAALADLCELYWYPLYVYARRIGADAEDARDLVQGFLLSLLEREDLRRVTPERGRFRSFLLASLKHYINNRRVHDRAQKRGGGQQPLALNLDEAETRFERAVAAPGDTPERASERQWALALLDQVFAEVRAEWEARGKVGEFDRLKSMLLDEDDRGFAAAARDLGTTETALRMSATRMRRRFQQVLRDTIAETVTGEAIDEEVRFLLDRLST